MSLLNLAIVIILVGLLLWAANRYVPMQAEIKTVLNYTVVIVLVLFILQILGVVDLLNIPLR